VQEAQTGISQRGCNNFVIGYRQFLFSVTPHVRILARLRCRGFGMPEGEAEDIAQEVLLAIHLKRGTWDQARPIGAWVTAITRNILIDALPWHEGHASVPIEDLAEIMPAGDQTPELSAGVNQSERN
jgi:DNA-directed RNA polymerase specialized sigma24 family protein